MSLGTHHFWNCDLSLTEEEVFEWELVQGPKQLTDVYLVALAARAGGKLVSFDHRIRWQAVRKVQDGVVEFL